MNKGLILTIWIFNHLGPALGDSVQSREPEVSKSEGNIVSLSCSYDTSSSDIYLFWYRQYQHQAPQYILRRGAKSYRDLSDTADFAQERFSSQAGDSSTVLNITALELADTAVYYCALQRAQWQSHGAELYKNPPLLAADRL
uniref:Ig-like domain-containing protein n=1 Tax=Gopherus evgoodei TaxID=1825980 RepID=A0A8C4Y5N7_9SAUR